MPNRPQVVITNWVHHEAIRQLRTHSFRVTANAARQPWPKHVWLRNVSRANALIAFMCDHVDESVLERCVQLRIVVGALKGFENIDIEACARRGITVTHAERSLTESVAELTIGLMIAVARNVLIGDRVVRGRQFLGWRPQWYGTGLSGSTVGLLGIGEIGRAVAARLRAFGCTLLYFDQRQLAPDAELGLGVEYCPLERMAAVSDFLVVAIPLTRATAHLIDADFLARMKPGAFLINPARGSVMDERAIARALRSRKLGGYAADVFEFEDWARTDRPQTVPRELLDSEHTVLTPHLGSAVDGVRYAVAMEAAETIIDFFAGRAVRGAVAFPGRQEAVTC